MPPGGGSYLGLISRSTTLSQLFQIHAQIVLSGHLSTGDVVTPTKLIQRLSELGGAAHARRLFPAVPSPDLFLFNVLIRSSAADGDPISALSLYRRLLREPRLAPDRFTFAFAFTAAATLGSDHPGRRLHAHAAQTGSASDPFAGSALSTLYFQFGRVACAEKVFEEIRDPDTVAWNALVSGLARYGYCGRAMRALARMLSLRGPRPDSATLAAVLPAAAELKDSSFGAAAHGLGTKAGLAAHAFVSTALISMYAKCGEISASWLVFKAMKSPDIIACNAMISGLSINGDVAGSAALFRDLLRSGKKASSSTLGGLIPVHSPFGHEPLCGCIHGFAVRSGLDVGSPVATALVTAYGRLARTAAARRVFDCAPPEAKTPATWNAVISAHAQNGETEAAVELFKTMREETGSPRPNPVTAASVLSACAQLGTLSLGEWAHRAIENERLEMNVFVSTALIDMYAKCGSVTEARRIFDAMEEKTVVSWNAMIAGYGLHGLGRDALQLFDEMLQAGMAPSSVTFLAALHACSHAGLVEEGRALFRGMAARHGVEPGPEHAACMVDLLGRAGRLREAVEFISGLAGEPGAGVWGALLGACMIHKDQELASMASERLFKLDPDSPGYQVLLSNILSAGRDYRRAALVRRGVKTKTPGCTTIELAGSLHVFTSGDRSHSRAAEIYRELERLMGKMAEAGYSAVTENALYDVEAEEKEQMLRVHSEKLAICFGLISTEPGAEIRIIKNLRVCVDCHSATKFISLVTGRVIVVRDANRFHHFKGGSCSCGDYW
ncbi:pentatricopeptide repeat-containing protein At4g30700-like [Wolffia australiana]